jgi:hypothetical protein
MSDIQDNKPLLTPKQVAEKGEQIYQEKLKSILEPKENGKFVTIEVNSGEYFLGDSLISPTFACAVQRHGLSVGANPTRHLSLQPEALGAVVEATK